MAYNNKKNKSKWGLTAASVFMAAASVFLPGPDTEAADYDLKSNFRYLDIQNLSEITNRNALKFKDHGEFLRQLGGLRPYLLFSDTNHGNFTLQNFVADKRFIGPLAEGGAACLAVEQHIDWQDLVEQFKNKEITKRQFEDGFYNRIKDYFTLGNPREYAQIQANLVAAAIESGIDFHYVDAKEQNNEFHDPAFMAREKELMAWVQKERGKFTEKADSLWRAEGVEPSTRFNLQNPNDIGEYLGILWPALSEDERREFYILRDMAHDIEYAKLRATHDKDLAERIKAAAHEAEDGQKSCAVWFGKSHGSNRYMDKDLNEHLGKDQTLRVEFYVDADDYEMSRLKYGIAPDLPDLVYLARERIVLSTPNTPTDIKLEGEVVPNPFQAMKLFYPDRTVKDIFIDETVLEATGFESHADFLFQIANAKTYLFFTDMNHFDLRLRNFTADDEFMATVSNKGRDCYAIEAPENLQFAVEQFQSGKMSENRFINTFMNYLRTNDPKAMEEVKHAAHLISQATKNGIRVYFVDGEEGKQPLNPRIRIRADKKVAGKIHDLNKAGKSCVVVYGGIHGDNSVLDKDMDEHLGSEDTLRVEHYINAEEYRRLNAMGRGPDLPDLVYLMEEKIALTTPNTPKELKLSGKSVPNPFVVKPFVKLSPPTPQ